MVVCIKVVVWGKNGKNWFDVGYSVVFYNGYFGYLDLRWNKDARNKSKRIVLWKV